MNKIYLIACIGILVGCDIFDKDEDIPAFVLINAADVESTLEQGANTSNITDVTVYASNQFMGTFELPAVVPILQSGNVEIALGPGIKNNGLISDRRIYPFYEFFRKEIILIPDAKIAIAPDTSITFQYFDEGLNFEIEDFEGQGYDLLPSTANTAFFDKISSPPENVQTGLSLEVILTPDSNNFEVRSDWNLSSLPKGNNIYLEIDFKGNNPLEIGIITKDPTVKKVFALGLNPKEEYTKVYVDLTDEIARQTTTNFFEIYLESRLPEGSQGAKLYIDNIKFIYP